MTNEAGEKIVMVRVSNWHDSHSWSVDGCASGTTDMS